MASQFGWSAVSREPMDHYDLLLAVLHMSEERVGKAVRRSQRERDAHEQAALGRLRMVKT